MPGQTIAVALSGTSDTATFQLPSNIAQFVDAVYAEIDNGAGGDATPTLEVKAPNGDTVAAIPQDTVIPAGDTGRATWALRLAGKTGGSTPSAAQIGFYDLDFASVASAVTTPLSFTYSFGDALLDLTAPTTPVFVDNGTYIIRATVGRTVLTNFAGKTQMVRLAMQSNYGTLLTVSGNAAPMDATSTGDVMSVAMPWIVAAATNFQVAVDHNAGVAQGFTGAVNVMKIG